MERLTLDRYKEIRAEVEHLEREITVSLANEELDGLPVLDADNQIREIRAKLRQARPVMRRKRAKKVNEENPRLVYSAERECWIVA